MDSWWISFIEGRGELVIYGVVFVFSLLEYVFPPFPSDTLLLFCAFLAGKGLLSPVFLFLPYLAGSIAGMYCLYHIGFTKGRNFFLQRDFWFFPRANIVRLEEMFDKYGPVIILSNRIFVGIRAAFFLAAGMGGMSRARVLSYGILSASLWGAGILTLGSLVGSKWEEISRALGTYSTVVFACSAALTLFFILRRLWTRRTMGRRDPPRRPINPE